MNVRDDWTRNQQSVRITSFTYSVLGSFGVYWHTRQDQGKRFWNMQIWVGNESITPFPVKPIITLSLYLRKRVLFHSLWKILKCINQDHQHWSAFSDSCLCCYTVYHSKSPFHPLLTICAAGAAVRTEGTWALGGQYFGSSPGVSSWPAYWGSWRATKEHTAKDWWVYSPNTAIGL